MVRVRHVRGAPTVPLPPWAFSGGPSSILSRIQHLDASQRLPSSPETVLTHNILCRDSPTQLLANQATPSISPRGYTIRNPPSLPKKPHGNSKTPELALLYSPHLADHPHHCQPPAPPPGFSSLGASPRIWTRIQTNPTRPRCQQRTLTTRWPMSATAMSPK